MVSILMHLKNLQGLYRLFHNSSLPSCFECSLLIYVWVISSDNWIIFKKKNRYMKLVIWKTCTPQSRQAMNMMNLILYNYSTTLTIREYVKVTQYMDTKSHTRYGHEKSHNKRTNNLTLDTNHIDMTKNQGIRSKSHKTWTRKVTQGTDIKVTQHKDKKIN